LGKAKNVITAVILVIVGFLVFVLLAGSMIGVERGNQLLSLSQEELEAMSVEWNYKDMIRNNEYYVGKIIHLDGKIGLVEEKGNDRFAIQVIVRQSMFDKDDNVIVRYKGERLLEKDKVDVYGRVEGLTELSFLWGKQTVPDITGIIVKCTNC